MEAIVVGVGLFLVPVLCAVFCLNMVGAMKNIKKGESTAGNVVKLTISFILIIWSVTIMQAGLS